MKVCADCREAKALDQFGKDKRRKDGLNVYCRACVRARSRRSREVPCYRQRHNEWRRAARTTPRGRASRLITDARTRSEIVTISLDWVAERLAKGTCEVTGIPFDLHSTGAPAAPFTPSLDQRTPGQGYTPENTQVVVWVYNRAKGVHDHAVVMRLAEALCKRHVPAHGGGNTRTTP